MNRCCAGGSNIWPVWCVGSHVRVEARPDEPQVWTDPKAVMIVLILGSYEAPHRHRALVDRTQTSGPHDPASQNRAITGNSVHSQRSILRSITEKILTPPPPRFGRGREPVSHTPLPLAPRARHTRARHCLSHSDSRDTENTAPRMASHHLVIRTARHPCVSAHVSARGLCTRTRHCREGSSASKPPLAGMSQKSDHA